MIVTYTNPAASGSIALWLTPARLWDNGNDAEPVRAHFARTIADPQEAAYAYSRWVAAVCRIVAPILRDSVDGVSRDITIEGETWTFTQDFAADNWI